MRPDRRLAITGGEPVRRKPWSDNFTTGQEELDALTAVMRSGYLSKFEGSHTPDPPFSFTGGPAVQSFEAAMSEYYGVGHAVSMNSATSGLYAAVGALGLGYGDEVIVSPYTMSACAVAPLIYGAIPVFADVEEDTGCLDPSSIASRITPRTRAILVVHQFGIPADMDPILALARKHGLSVIEDCAQAHGARYKGSLVGTLGDIGVFSFNVNKTIQAGEGGCCLTRDADLAYRLQLIRNHGEAVVGPAGYANTTNILGFNYRMTELHAAVSLAQLRKLDALNTQRLELVDVVKNSLHDCESVSLLPGRRECHSTWYVLPMQFNAAAAGISRNDFANHVRAEGVFLYQGYVRPLYLQPLYQQRHAFKNGYPWAAPENRDSTPDYSKGSCPTAERLHFERLLISEHVRPPHDALDMRDICAAITKVAASLAST
jgi:perosamine synthetase